MPEGNHIDANSADVLLMVGTMKGAFLLRSKASAITDYTTHHLTTCKLRS